MKYQPARRVYVDGDSTSVRITFEMISGEDIRIVINKTTAGTDLLPEVYRLVCGHNIEDRFDPNASNVSEK